MREVESCLEFNRLEPLEGVRGGPAGVTVATRTPHCLQSGPLPTRTLWGKLWVRSILNQVFWYHSAGTEEARSPAVNRRHVTRYHSV